MSPVVFLYWPPSMPDLFLLPKKNSIIYIHTILTNRFLSDMRLNQGRAKARSVLMTQGGIICDKERRGFPVQAICERWFARICVQLTIKSFLSNARREPEQRWCSSALLVEKNRRRCLRSGFRNERNNEIGR